MRTTRYTPSFHNVYDGLYSTQRSCVGSHRQPAGFNCLSWIKWCHTPCFAMLRQAARLSGLLCHSVWHGERFGAFILLCTIDTLLFQLRPKQAYCWVRCELAWSLKGKQCVPAYNRICLKAESRTIGSKWLSAECAGYRHPCTVYTATSSKYKMSL